MPWYFATYDGRVTHAYGVRTGAKALCFWQVDPQGISAVGGRAQRRRRCRARRRGRSTSATIVCRQGRAGESAFAAAPRVLQADVREAAAADASRSTAATTGTGPTARTAPRPCSPTRSTSSSSRPTGANRPFAVIDDGWQPERGQAEVRRRARGIAATRSFRTCRAWRRRSASAGARPGIWIRPLLAPADAPDAGDCRAIATILDPTVPEVRQKVADDIARLRGWGYELIKHDYSTFDIFGRWGSTMGDALTRDGWTFADGPDADDRGSDRRAVSDDSRRPPAMRSSSAATPSAICRPASSTSAASATTRAAASGRARARWASTRWRFAARSTARSTSPTPTASASRTRCRGR